MGVLSEGFELYGEVAHQFGLPGDLHTAGDFVAAVIHVLESGRDHIHVVVGVGAAADAETQEVVTGEAVLAGDGITVGEKVTDLAATYAGFEIELHGETLCGELLLGDAVEHLVGVDEEGVTAHGTLIGDAVLVELGCEVFNLLDAGLEHIELGVLVKTYGEGGHVAAVHAAVGEEAFERNHEALRALVDVLPAGCDESTHVDQTVLFRRHCHYVSQREHLLAYLLDGGVFVLRVAHLDEVCVLGEAGRVENDALVVLVGDLAHAAEVVHRNGLSAGGVVCDRHDDERYLVGVLGKAFLKLVEIHVALEGHFELGVLCLVDGAVYSESLAALDVTLGGVEVRVARNDVAFLHEVGEKHVLGSAALVGGDHILEACDAGDSILQLIERACTCVALVSGHHRRPLAVAHRACTRVGDTVDVNLIRTEHEHIVFGFFKPLLALFAGTLLDGFDHLDFP